MFMFDMRAEIFFRPGKGRSSISVLVIPSLLPHLNLATRQVIFNIMQYHTYIYWMPRKPTFILNIMNTTKIHVYSFPPYPEKINLRMIPGSARNYRNCQERKLAQLFTETLGWGKICTKKQDGGKPRFAILRAGASLPKSDFSSNLDFNHQTFYFTTSALSAPQDRHKLF